ncbi:MAG: hypothetical protein FWC76_07680 [Defluviitaleaceae bacterium]|nr:hypothetical protein [Defluviitaleaceae bacterium]
MKKVVLFASVSFVCFGLLALSILLNMDSFAPRDALYEPVIHREAAQEYFVFGTSPIDDEASYYDNDNDDDNHNDIFLTAFPLYHFREDLHEVYDEIGHISEMIVPADSFLFIMNEGGISTGGFIASDMDIQGFAVLPRSDLWILNNFDRYLMHYLENGTMGELKIIYDVGLGGSTRFFFVNGNYDLIEASLQASAQHPAYGQTCLLMSEERARGIILANVAQAAQRGLDYAGLLIRNDSLHRLYREATASDETVAARSLVSHPLSSEIRLEIKEFEPRSGRMVITFINDTDYTIRVNTEYSLEFFNRYFWQDVPLHPGASLPFTVFTVLPQRSMDFIVFLENFPTQDAGLFRLRRDFEIEGSYESYDVVVQFYRP